MIFAGISGSAVADTAGVSGMFMPEMVRKGYSKKFTVAVTAISSTIGIIIPPSIPMVVIAGICGISTGRLFLGGIIPGIMCGLAQMIVSYFMAKKEGVEKEPGHFSIGPVLHGLWESWPALLMPIIIVGTITLGIVSPTEAGVIAVVYGLFAGGIVYRELKWEDIKFAFAETVRTSGRIFIVIGAAKLYTVMLTTAGFDKWVAKTMLGFSSNPHRHPHHDPADFLHRDHVHGVHRDPDPVHAHPVPHRHRRWHRPHRSQRAHHRGHRRGSGYASGWYVHLRGLRFDGRKGG